MGSAGVAVRCVCSVLVVVAGPCATPPRACSDTQRQADLFTHTKGDQLYSPNTSPNPLGPDSTRLEPRTCGQRHRLLPTRQRAGGDGWQLLMEMATHSPLPPSPRLLESRALGSERYLCGFGPGPWLVVLVTCGSRHASSTHHTASPLRHLYACEGHQPPTVLILSASSTLSTA